MRFFEVLHVDIAQKLQILKILTIFSDFSVDFQLSLILWGVKKNSKKGSNELELMLPFREHEFWAKFGSRAKIDRGGSRSPPPHLTLRRHTG